jgi:hypothetical protein
MIRIENTDYYIDADEHCFILTKWNGKYRKDRPTELDCPEYTYYSFFVNLLESLAKRMLREKIAESTTLGELKPAIREINALIARIEKDITPDAIRDARKGAGRAGGRI